MDQFSKVDQSGNLWLDIARQKELLAKIGRNWSTGPDENFGGRFVCIHGLSQEEADALIAAGKSAR